MRSWVWLFVPAAMLARSPEPVYRVRVSLQGQTVRGREHDWQLQPGTLVDASVRLESRRLYQWLLAPMTALTTSS